VQYIATTLFGELQIFGGEIEIGGVGQIRGDWRPIGSIELVKFGCNPSVCENDSVKARATNQFCLTRDNSSHFCESAVQQICCSNRP